jgi:hypothetical protein
VLAALPLLSPGDVSSGVGWGLVTGVGLATYVAHLYAEVVGDHVRHTAAHEREELGRAMADGSPILLATLAPGVFLLLGRLDVLEPRVTLWAAVVAAIVQLVGLGFFVGFVASGRRSSAWLYGSVTAAFGLTAVVLKVGLGH